MTPSASQAAQVVTLTDTFTETIQIFDNVVRDGDRQFRLNLGLSSTAQSGEFETAGNIPTAPAVIGEPSEATVTIGDNEVAGGYHLNVYNMSLCMRKPTILVSDHV